MAVVKPMGTSLDAGGLLVGGRSGGVGGGVPSARIFVAFCSDMPFICSSTLLGLSRILAV